RADRLAETFVGNADDDGVADRRVLLEDLLDLLGEHLLAARVDAHRAAPEHAYGAVGLHRGEVAGDRVAGAVDLAERTGRLLGILVVADRARTANREHADLARPRLHVTPALGDHTGAGAEPEAGRRRRGAGS